MAKRKNSVDSANEANIKPRSRVRGSAPLGSAQTEKSQASASGNSGTKTLQTWPGEKEEWDSEDEPDDVTGEIPACIKRRKSK